MQTTKTSVHGAINMLGLAKRVGATILQASTSEVQGDPTVHPQPEKRCVETLFFDYRRQHRVINLGNPVEFTILQLAEIVIELTRSKSRIDRLPLPADDPRQRQPDIRRTRELLRREPTIALRDGLLKTIAFFDDLLRNGLAK